MAEDLVAHAGLLLAWAAWCAVHSLLAADAVADRVRPLLGPAAGRYRLAYNAVAAATLLPLYLATRAAGSPPAWAWHGAARVGQAALLGASAWLFFGGARSYDLRQFLGLGAPGAGGLAARGGIVTDGVLGVVRHPWYLGGLLVVWARDLRRLDVWVNVVLCAYLVAGALLEERRLLRRFGDEYRAYRRRVPMLLPLRPWGRWGGGGKGGEG